MDYARHHGLEYLDLVKKHFQFLSSEFHFEEARYVNTGKHQYVEFTGKHLIISIDHDRYSALDVLVELSDGRSVIDVREIYRIIGVVQEEAFVQEWALTHEDIDLSLSLLARHLRQYGSALLREDPQLLQRLGCQ